jgi:hypothetical protein
MILSERRKASQAAIESESWRAVKEEKSQQGFD